MTRLRKEPSAAIRGLPKQQLTTCQIREELVEGNGNFCIRGCSLLRQKQQALGRFLGKGVNYVDAWPVHRGDFTARVICCYPLDLSLIAWRPFDASGEYQRMAKLTSEPLPPIRLNSDDIAHVSIAMGDLVGFSARVTVIDTMVKFETGAEELIVLGFEEREGEIHGS
jgi:hypothetical protein